MTDQLAPGQVLVGTTAPGIPLSYSVEVVRADGSRQHVVYGVPEAVAWAVRDRVAAALAACEAWALDLIDVSAGQLRG